MAYTEIYFAYTEIYFASGKQAECYWPWPISTAK